jgi:hypothetical protein
VGSDGPDRRDGELRARGGHPVTCSMGARHGLCRALGSPVILPDDLPLVRGYLCSGEVEPPALRFQAHLTGRRTSQIVAGRVASVATFPPSSTD